MRNFQYLSIVLLTVLLGFSCDPDTGSDDDQVVLPPIETEEEQNARIKTVISSEEVLTNLVVTVVTIQGSSVANANVTVGETTITTNDQGIAVFENEIVNKDFVACTAEKTGFEKALRTVTPSTNGITNVTLVLIEDVPELTFEAETGGTLTAGETTLVFPANAIVDAEGNTYTGTVTMNVIYYGTEDPNFEQIQPGILVGITDENESVGLVSEGMVTVDLTDNAGNELNIANDTTVQITMPATADSPNTIPLWNLNETYGLWVEEGSAMKRGNVYEFEVRHFSTYNLDAKVPNTINFCLDVTTTAGVPLANSTVSIRYEGFSTGRSYRTDNMGQLCFRNARATAYTVILSDFCEPRSGTVTVPSAGTYTVSIDTQNDEQFNFSGTLADCNGELLMNKYFSVTIEDFPRPFVGYTDASGNYGITGFACNATTSGIKNAVFVVEDTSGTITNAFTVDTTQPVQTIDLSCGTVDPFPDDLEIEISSGHFCFVEYMKLIGVPVRVDDSGVFRKEFIRFGDIKNIRVLGGNPNNAFEDILCNEGLEPAVRYFVRLERIELTLLLDDVTPLIGLENLREVVLYRDFAYGQRTYDNVVQMIRENLPNVTITTVDL